MTFLTRASLAVLTGVALLLPACGGGGGGSSSHPGGGGGGGTNPTPMPTPTAVVDDFVCPTSDGTSSAVRIGTRSSGAEATRHAIVRAPKTT
ncbi:MAG: hypothetical protein ACREML_13060, partial [Vulcanimicrobiaceae bacterium]